jgi:eukaryotic-like serine/threonine-protein kinase
MRPKPIDSSETSILAPFLEAWESGSPAPAIPSDPEAAQIINDAQRIWQKISEQATEYHQQKFALNAAAPKFIGRFQIIRELGRGGFGVVYHVLDPQIGREIALKVPLLPALLVPDARKRFIREAELAGQLDHPNIVPLYESGEIDQLGYIATAYIPGVSLSEWLQVHHEELIDPKYVAEFMSQIADGVHHAHLRGVLHRDLKPANILLQPISETSIDVPEVMLRLNLDRFKPRITDFGLGRALSENDGISRTGELIGTISHVSPEQAIGPKNGIDIRSDIWSQGIILYELLTNRLPFHESTSIATMQKIVSESPIRIRAIRPEISADLEAICMKCLEKHPNHRYASSDAFATDLRRYLSGRSTLARPLGNLRLAARWANRHPTQIIFAMMIIGLLILGPLIIERFRSYENRLEAQRKTEAATQKLADERERAILFETIHRRLMERPSGWIEENRRDFDQIDTMIIDPKSLPGLRTDLATTLAGTEWLPIAKILPDTRIECCAFAPSGGYFAAASNSVNDLGLGTITLVDSETLISIRRLVYGRHPILSDDGKPLEKVDGTRSLTFSPDGRYLYQGTRSGWVHQFDLDTSNHEMVSSWKAHPRMVNTMCIAPDGKYLYTSSEAEKKVVSWDTTNAGNQVAKFDVPDPKLVLQETPALQHLGNQLYYRIGDDQTWWLNPQTLNPDPDRIDSDPTNLLSDQSSIGGASFCPATKSLLIGSREIDLMDTRNGLKTIRLAVERDPILNTDVAHAPRLDPTGRYGAVLLDGQVVIWEIASGNVLSKLPLPPLGGIDRQMSFHPLGKRLVISGQPTLVLDLVESEFESWLAREAMPIRRFALTSDAKTIGTLSSLILPLGSTQTSIRITEISSNRSNEVVFDSTAHTRDELAISPSGDFILWSPELDWTSCVNVATKQTLWKRMFESISPQGGMFGIDANKKSFWAGRSTFLVRHTLLSGDEEVTQKIQREGRGIHQIWSMSIQPNLILTGNRDGFIDAFSPISVSSHWSIQLGLSGITALATKENVSTAIAGTLDGEIIETNLAEQKILRRFQGHAGMISSIDLSPDNQYLATSGFDGQLLIWRRETKGWSRYCSLPTNGRSVKQLQFDPKTSKLYVLLAGERGIRVWNLELLFDRSNRLQLASTRP